MNNQQSLPVVKPVRFPHAVLWMLFFFQYAAIGVYFTFLNVYYREAGLSGTQIGLLNMVNALMGMGGSFMWGYLGDRTGKNRLLIAVGAVGALLTVQFVPLVHSFEAYLVLGAVCSLMGSASGTLVDSTTLALLGERRNDYGRYRLGGTIGYILTASSVGFLFDRIGLDLMFPAYGVVMAAFAAVALLLPMMPVRSAEQTKGEVGAMVRQPAWILMIACVFLTWIATNASIMFTGVSMHAMGANQGLIGVAVTVGAVVEIPFMMYSPLLLRRFGPERLLLIAMSLMIVRFFLLGWMPAPEWAVAINLLNGPAFVFFWNSAVTLANKMAPQGLAGTAQGLLSSTMSLAGVFSALLTGWLFDLLGPNKLFVVMAFCVLAALLLFGFGQLRFRRIAAHDSAQDSGVTEVSHPAA